VDVEVSSMGMRGRKTTKKTGVDPTVGRPLVVRVE
jgi:hypothetical protein